MFQSEFSMNLSNYVIKLADSNFKTFTSENKPTFWLIKFLALFEFCFTFDNLWKKNPLWEAFSNFEKTWWNSYKKWLLANKAEAKRREKRPSKTAPAKIQGQFSLFQYCKRPLRWGQSTLALLWARGLKGHDAWQGFSPTKTAGMFQIIY